MTPKRQRTQDELEALLAEQLQFLRASSIAYDSGFEGEAKRLAVTLRVLLHDTAGSHSLLGQLGRKSRLFMNTSLPDVPGNVQPYTGLTTTYSASGSVANVALLDDPFFTEWVPFDDWWSAVVFRDRLGGVLTRRNLILTAANQDGGAHVDPALDETYARLTIDNSMDWFVEQADGSHPLQGHETAAIRQIAHEVLRTLIPDYECHRTGAAGFYLGGVQAFNAPVRAEDEPPGVQAVGRNEPCPCGSGKKYKRCHGWHT